MIISDNIHYKILLTDLIISIINEVELIFQKHVNIELWKGAPYSIDKLQNKLKYICQL